MASNTCVSVVGWVSYDNPSGAGLKIHIQGIFWLKRPPPMSGCKGALKALELYTTFPSILTLFTRKKKYYVYSEKIKPETISRSKLNDKEEIIELTDSSRRNRTTVIVVTS
jgi:hypothetical protein